MNVVPGQRWFPRQPHAGGDDETPSGVLQGSSVGSASREPVESSKPSEQPSGAPWQDVELSVTPRRYQDRVSASRVRPRPAHAAGLAAGAPGAAVRRGDAAAQSGDGNSGPGRLLCDATNFKPLVHS